MLPTAATKALSGFFGNTGSTTGTQTVQPFGIDTGIDSSNTTGFARWLNPQPLDASRTYTWDMPDLNEILLDINQAGPDWNKTPGGAKILLDLQNDPARINTLSKLPGKSLGPKQSWKDMVTATDIDRLSSRMMGGGFYGPNLQRISGLENSLIENILKEEKQDLQHWNEGHTGYFQDTLKDLGLDLDPFNIMYADELKELSTPNPHRYLQDTILADNSFTVNTEQPVNLGQTHADTLQSFFNIPEVTEEQPEVTPVGTDSGTVIVEDTPDGTIVTDNTPVFNTPIVDPSTWLPDDHIDTTPVLNPFEPLTEDQTVFDRTTPGPIGDYLREQELDYMIDEVFTQEDKAAEDEQKRINEIAAKAEQDRIRLEKQAEDARKRQLAHEKQAREARERADRIEREARERDEQIQADDRKAIARARREEEQRNEKAKAAADKKRQAVEAARLNALAAAAKKQAAAAKKREEENKKKQEAESQRLHKLNMEMLARMRRDREERARQQASMPKSWAFF